MSHVRFPTRSSDLNGPPTLKGLVWDAAGRTQLTTSPGVDAIPSGLYKATCSFQSRPTTDNHQERRLTNGAKPQTSAPASPFVLWSLPAGLCVGSAILSTTPRGLAADQGLSTSATAPPRQGVLSGETPTKKRLVQCSSKGATSGDDSCSSTIAGHDGMDARERVDAPSNTSISVSSG